MITNSYSTSFSLGIRMFDKKFREPVYSIYGFVRFADEIVDSFHHYPREELLEEFRRDTRNAIERGISINPVLQSFQEVARDYDIGWDLIEPFLASMEMDLKLKTYNRPEYDRYIYGSAEVVGLMCLKVFCEGDPDLYDRLKEPAMKLGSAFQKVNFLRDIKADYHHRGRFYFPNVDYTGFSDRQKREIEEEIAAEFDEAYRGILKLPTGARFGVYLAYLYYRKLFRKISDTAASRIKDRRIRIGNARKIYLIIAGRLSIKFKTNE